MNGREIRASQSTGAANASATALGALQRQPLGCELAEHEREVRDHHRDGDEGDGARDPGDSPHPTNHGSREGAICAAPKPADTKPARVTPTCTAARNRFGSAVRARQPTPPSTGLREPLDLALAQRHQRDLRSGEEPPDAARTGGRRRS